MNIILLEDGVPGRLEHILDDDPIAHLSDLLGGGELESTPLTDKLTLFTRKGAENELPIRYRVETRRLVFPVYGNCAVLRHLAGGRLCNISQRLDPDTVDRMVTPIQEV